MVTQPQLFTATVAHQRLFPKRNAFRYGVYYLALPLPTTAIGGRLVRFDPRDVGARDGSDPTPWVRAILADYGLDDKAPTIILVTMPRVLGYVFNPVSFYLCLDDQQALRAVVCEVHNTFGEQHSYVCAHPDHAPITANDWLVAEKLFHVSPFLTRQGQYKFRFSYQDNKLAIWIDYFDESKNKQLLTSLVGNLISYTPKSLNKLFWKHPLLTVKAIVLIHWQALKLVLRGIRYFSKPLQLPSTITTTQNLTKM